MQKRIMIVTGLLCCLASAVSLTGQKAVFGAEDGSQPETGGINMYRLYNPNSGEHFYTSSDSEKGVLVKSGWMYEGIGWIAPSTGDPVYRLYNPNAGDHVYTLDSAERDNLENAGWRYEGICWYSDTDESCPVYRQYNPNATSGSHNFTTSVSEENTLIQAGWCDEGIAWYAEATSSTADGNSAEDDSSSGGDTANEGDAGNLTIPAIGTDVALYSDGDAQTIVNQEDSAAYLESYAEPIIADHNYQSNFSQLKNCSGQYCYLTRNGSTVRYQCVRVEAGTNTGSALITASGVNVTKTHVSDLVIYTCQTSSEGGGVWITEWNVA
jgi:hypothetical protein